MSELKRVAFTTLTSNVGGVGNVASNGGGGGGGGGGNCNSIVTVDGLSSSSSINLKKGTNFNSATAAAAGQSNHNEYTPRSLSSTSMPPPLSSISTSAGLSSLVATNTTANPPDSMMSQQQQQQTSSSSSKTIRLELELFEPNSGSFAEFNYLGLVKVEKKKMKKLSRINGFSDPFEENDDEIARIAKEFEKKYGNSSTVGSNRRRNKKDDCYDKGAGYDESDSFIDNTEAYDEIIPDEVETVEGGFYINSGALEFKHLSNYDKSDDIIKMNKTTTKKRALSSSTSSSSDDGDDESNEAEEETEGNSSPRENPITTTNTALKLKNGHIDKKLKHEDASDKESNNIKVSASSSTITSSSSLSLIKHNNKDNKQDGKQRSENNRIKIKDDVKTDETYIEPIKEKDKEKTIKTTTVKDMLKAKRDNFRKMQEGAEGKMKLTNGEIVKSSASNESSDTSADDSDDTTGDEPNEKKFKKNDDDTEKLRANDVKLPDTLNKEMLKNIEEIKEIGKSQIQFSKTFQFDEKTIDLFLRIDDDCQCLDKSIRNLVFAHIEYQLLLPKYFLLRKSKQLRIKQEKTKTKKAFTKLKKSVNEIMPSVLLQYETNYNKVDEIRSLLSSTGLEEMDHPPKYPKKKFPWNENLRNLLYDLYQARWMSYTVLRTRKEGFDEFVNNYLRNKVVSIWPSGWMKYEDLKKELERRKSSMKRPKENKKPIVVDLTSTTTSSTSHKRDELSIATENADTYSINSTTKSQSLDLVSKSLLSSSNSLSVVSTKDLVVTIATKNNNSGGGNEKLSSSSATELSSSVQQSNSLSITQVSTDNNDSKLTKNLNNSGTTGKDVSSLNRKSSKSNGSSSSSSSVSSNSGSSKSPSPSHLDYVTSTSTSLKPCNQNLSAFSSNNYNKSSNNNNKSNTDKSANGSSNNSPNSSNHNKLPNLTTSSSSPPTNKGPIDLVSPTKRSTDHSISSIISSSSATIPPTTTNMNVNKSPSSSTDTSTTHVITVDNLKSTTDIINTTNQLINNSGGETSNSANSKEGSIRIRSFANVNSNLENDRLTESKNSNSNNNNNNNKNGGSLKSDNKNVQEQDDSSSESDGVEIVGVYPANTIKKENQVTKSNKINKNKKSSKISSRSDSPVNPKTNISTTNVQNLDKITKTSAAAAGTGDIKETELDVNQIMRALKELEIMQQSGIHITNSSPSTSSSSNNRSGNNSGNTSSVSYGKDNKQ